MLNEIISASLIFIVPTMIGAFIYILTYFKENNQKLKLDLAHLATALGHSFVYGALILFFQAAFITTYFVSNFEQYFLYITIGEIIIGVLGTILILIKKRREIEIDIMDLPILLLLMILAGVAYGIWRWNSPVTATLDWDMFMHQSAVRLIREGKFNFDTLKISDTFKFYSYPPMFHTVILGAQIFFKNLDVPTFWWFAQLWHFFATIVASYTLGYALTRKKIVGITSAIISTFIFESFIAYTSLFLIPQTLAALNIVLFVAGEILRYTESKKIIEISTIATVCYLVLNHMIIGFAGIFIILLSIIYLRLFKNKDKKTWHRILIGLAILSIPILYLLATHMDLGSINRGEAASFNLTLKDKIYYMKVFYGYFFLVLFPIGLLTIFFKKPKTNETLGLLIALGVLAFVAAPLPYVLKFYTIGRYFVHAVMAIGISQIMETNSHAYKTFQLMIISIGLAIVFAINVGTFKQNILYAGRASHISTAEYEAGKYLKMAYKRNDLLISDPTTMHIMEGISGINTPGGAFTDLKTRKLISKIFFSRDSLQMRTYIRSIQDGIEENYPDKVLLVISGRFSKWQLSSEVQKEGIVWNIWKPNGLNKEDLEYIDFIDKNLQFKKVYIDPEIVVYEIK